ncbi:hypothetical protein TrST_g4622 [Triparma strigata]|uniref:J domain-containing protein n=1 Tax=Triparma strigata TaxID=1606541 RepID=A0A9W7BYT0_9STRA|nr:hypothetical protein TrST_g4622 [Triparma strigata]
MSSLVRSSYLICPICSSHLCDHRALRNHLQSSRHAIVRKSELDSLVEAARNGEGEAIYQGDLAKGGRDKNNRVKNNRDIKQTPAEEPTMVATIVELLVHGKNVGVCFGENTNGDMIVTKVPQSSELYSESKILKGGKILSMNDLPCETRSDLQRAFKAIGSSRPINLKFMTTPGNASGFTTDNRRERREEEENDDDQITNDNLSKSEDLYAVLEVDRNVKVRQIQESYKRLAAIRHPDSGGSTESFQELNRAFRILSDSKTRARYDKHSQRLHPFIEAAKNDDLPRLLNFDPDQFTSHSPASNITDRHGSNALHYAAGSGASSAVLSYLIDTCRIDIDSMTTLKKTTSSSRTPLHWAARNGHTETCRWLVERGADYRKSTSDGTTCVHWSLWNAHTETCLYFISAPLEISINVLNSFSCNAGHFIGLNGSVPTLAFFYEIGGDVRKRNNQGHTVVHKAAWRGRVELLEYLRGILEVELFGQVDYNGYTPMDVARLAGEDGTVKWLENVLATKTL